MILSCQNIKKSFLIEEIIHNASFHIEDREKAAIIGMNGSGKSTLLKIIMRELEPDSGEVYLAKGKSIGYLAQHQNLDTEKTIHEEMLDTRRDLLDMEQNIRKMEQEISQLTGDSLHDRLEAYDLLNHTFEQQNGYAYQSEVIGILKGLGFPEEDFNKRVTTLSGGQKTRIALGKLLLTNPDIILLDEPTNHLDMSSIQWLEGYLSNYAGAVLIVAHDRYFLDKVVTKIVELENKVTNVYTGNYTAYAEKKAMLRQAQLNAYLNQQKEVKRQEEIIARLRSYKQEKFYKRAQSREKVLDKMEMKEKPTDVSADMKLKLTPQIESGNDVLFVEGLSKSYGRLQLFENLDFTIKKGEKVALIGNNGTGKTTILKILNKLESADAGSFRYGTNVNAAYYDQEHQVLHPEKTIFEEMEFSFPALSNTQIRNVLAAFLFTGDDVFKKIHNLSGGERGRVSLAKLMLSKANLLILDEPTNHLDITSKEILESAVNNYTGTVLYVSHDRYFINKTASRILDLSGRTLINYLGNYDYYLEKKDDLMKTFIQSEEAAAVTEGSSKAKQDWIQRKQEQSRQRKMENDLKRTEEKIHELETRDTEIDTLMEEEEVFTNVQECIKLSEEKAKITEQLAELYRDWESLAEYV